MPNETNYIGVAMGMDVTDLKAGLYEANKQIQLANSKFKAAASEMDDWTKSTDGLNAKIEQLSTVLKMQESKLAGLNAEYEKTVKEQGENSEAARILQVQINNQQAVVNKTAKELKNYKSTLEAAENGTIDLEDVTLRAGKAVEKAGKQAEEAGDGFTVAKGAVAGFIADGLSKVVDFALEAASNLMNLAEETREYREDLGKLKTAFDTAGHSGEEATAVYKELYSVFGEEDRAVEAAQQIANIADGEEEFTRMTNIATGAWARWGDSLATESLMEAISSTAKMGTIQGTLADALNWAAAEGQNFGVVLKENIAFTELSESELESLTEAERASYEAKKAQYEATEEYNKAVEEAVTAEDKFNLALEACNSEQERQQLILDTLDGLYSDYADNYRETNAEIIKSRKQTSDYNDTLAEMGEAMEPVQEGVTSLKNEFAKKFLPVLKRQVIPAITDFLDETKNSKVLDTFSKALGFVSENFTEIATTAGVALTVWKTFSAALAVKTAIQGATTAIAGLTAGVGFATKAQTVWNAVMAANPIGAVLTAVGLLAAGIAALVITQNNASKSTDHLSESQREAVTAAQDAADAYRDTKSAADEMAASELANIGYTQNLWKELQTLADENGKVKEGYESRAEFIITQLNEALGTEYGLNGDIIQQYKDMKTSIEDVILAKKAQILLTTYEESYKKAIENVAEAEKARALQAQEVAAQQDKYRKAEKEYQDAQAELQAKMANAKTEQDFRMLASEARWVESLKINAQAEKNILEEKQGEYNETELALYGYYQDIANYEKASTLVLEGETQKAVNLLGSLSGGFQTVASTAQLSADEQKKILGQQVIDTEVNARLMKEAYANGVEGVSEEMVETAKEQADAAKEEFLAVGGDITKGIAEGAEGEEWTLSSTMSSLIDKAISAARKAAGINSPSRRARKEVGKWLGIGTGKGVLDSMPLVKKDIEKFNDYLISNMADGSISQLSGGIASNTRKIKSGLTSTASDTGAGGRVRSTVVHAGLTVNYNGKLSRKEIKQLENDNYTAVRTRLKAEGAI